MHYHKLFNILGSLLILLSCMLQAEEVGPITTNRPGISNPTSSVPSGLYQFEIGTKFNTGPGMDTTFTIPVQLRMGVYKNTELHVAYASEYLTLGIQYGGISFLDDLENSIILTTSMTNNNDSLTEYSTYLPISYSFKNGFSVWGQVAGTVMNIEDSDPIISYILAVGKSFGKRSSWFIESYQSRLIDQNDPPFSIDYGFTYLPDNNVQFDISMGISFANDKEDEKYKESSRFIESGVSFRLPH